MFPKLAPLQPLNLSIFTINKWLIIFFFVNYTSSFWRKILSNFYCTHCTTAILTHKINISCRISLAVNIRVFSRNKTFLVHNLETSSVGSWEAVNNNIFLLIDLIQLAFFHFPDSFPEILPRLSFHMPRGDSARLFEKDNKDFCLKSSKELAKIYLVQSNVIIKLVPLKVKLMFYANNILHNFNL